MIPPCAEREGEGVGIILVSNGIVDAYILDCPACKTQRRLLRRLTMCFSRHRLWLLIAT